MIVIEDKIIVNLDIYLNIGLFLLTFKETYLKLIVPTISL